MDTSGAAAPVAKLTELGGYALTWSPDSKTLHWALGPALHASSVDSGLHAGMASPTTIDVGLTVTTDVPSGALASTNGRIITMVGEQVIDRGTVVVRANRITAVGPSDQVTIPADAKVLDVSGKTVMPGLVDFHGHIDNCGKGSHFAWDDARHRGVYVAGTGTRRRSG